ncbi:hypothetical protein BGW38_002572 [Lunasporangiospora selenospora]|uniref:Uncharacterized protein n=1 Tax=Lunasporangiospora selenospora TaxID=979761 RepID=A0A9P6FRV7_9FUNG|nr:hypothetical protein BGW38_002572 [Lunasporangiospora selenospora]
MTVVVGVIDATEKPPVVSAAAIGTFNLPAEILVSLVLVDVDGSPTAVTIGSFNLPVEILVSLVLMGVGRSSTWASIILGKGVAAMTSNAPVIVDTLVDDAEPEALTVPKTATTDAELDVSILKNVSKMSDGVSEGVFVSAIVAGAAATVADDDVTITTAHGKRMLVIRASGLAALYPYSNPIASALLSNYGATAGVSVVDGGIADEDEDEDVIVAGTDPNADSNPSTSVDNIDNGGRLDPEEDRCCIDDDNNGAMSDS